MQFASDALHALQGDPGGAGHLFSHRWVIEFKTNDKLAVPMVPISTRDKVCSLFGAIFALGKGGLILPSKDKSKAPAITSPSDLPADQAFYEYFAPLPHNKSVKGVICFKSEANFATLRKALWSKLRSSSCWITQTKIPVSTEIRALGWFQYSIPRFFEPEKVRMELNKLIPSDSKMNFNSPLIDMVPATIYSKGSTTRAVKIFVADGNFSEAMDIFIKAFNKLSTDNLELKKECPNVYDYKFVPFKLNVGDIKVDTVSVVASLIEEHKDFLASRSHVFIQNADVSLTINSDVKELNNRILGDILWEACPDIIKIHQRTNKFGSVIYLEVPSEKEGDILDVIYSKVETVKSTATHLAVNLDEPVTVMSASNYSAPARKKHKMVVQSNFELQSFIRATIPNITSYANVVAGKKEKKARTEQFPTLNEANAPAPAPSDELSSLTKASIQAEEKKNQIVDDLNRKVATLESIVVKTLDKLEMMEKLLSTFLVHLNNSQCKSVVDPLTIHTMLGTEKESHGTKLMDMPTELTSPNLGPNTDQNRQQSLSMDIEEMKDSTHDVKAKLPNMNKEASHDIDMPLKPTTGKHPRETTNESVPEQNMSPTQRKTLGPMDKYVNSQSPLPALNGTVQRGGDQ